MATTGMIAEDAQQHALLRALKRQYRIAGNTSPFANYVQRIGVPNEVDVPEIHPRARDAIRREIDAVSRGNGSRIVVLAGPNGVGKSHLLDTLVRNSNKPARDGEPEYVVVSPGDISSASDVVSHLLDYLLDALDRPIEGNNGNPSRSRLEDRLRSIASFALKQIAQDPLAMRAALRSRGVRGFGQVEISTRLGRRRDQEADR